MIMMPEAAPHDETALVYERAMPAMRRREIPHAVRATETSVAGMARSYTGEKGCVSR